MPYKVDVKYKLLQDQSTKEEFEDIELYVRGKDDSNSDLSGGSDNDVEVIHSKSTFWTRYRGYIFAFLSCLFFATGSVFVKLLHGSISAMAVVAVRSLIQIVCCIAVICIKRLNIWRGHTNQTRFFLVVRGTLGGSSLVFYFYAFQNMPIGDASAIIFSSPIYVSMLAWLFLGEKVGCLEFITLCLTIIGVIFVSQPSFLFHHSSVYVNSTNVTTGPTTLLNRMEIENSTSVSISVTEKPETNHVFAPVSAFIGSLSASFAFIALRKVPTVHYTLPIFYASFSGIVVSCIVVLATKSFNFPAEFKPWSYAMIVGLCGIFGQTCLTKAFQSEKAGPVSIIRQLDIVLAYIYQILIFKEQPHVLNILGGSLVISGAVLLALKKMNLLTSLNCSFGSK